MEINRKAFTWYAAGFTAAFTTLQLTAVKNALDFHYYQYHIDLYVPVNLLVCLGMIVSQVLAAGSLLTKININNGTNT